MNASADLILRAAARLYWPVAVLFAFAIAATPDVGLARGAAAGFALALAFVLHVLIAGAHSARRAAPPWLMRVFLAVGLGGSIAAALTPHWAFAGVLALASVALASAGACGLALTMLAARAPTLRDEDW